jgi:hypothetical protein
MGSTLTFTAGPSPTLGNSADDRLIRLGGENAHRLETEALLLSLAGTERSRAGFPHPAFRLASPLP